MQQPRTLYEPGEISPASDDSTAAYYDSPQSYAHALADNHCYVPVYDNSYPSQLYDHATPAVTILATQLTCEPGSDDYGPSYDYGHLSPASYEEAGGYANLQSCRQLVCADYIRDSGHRSHSLEVFQDPLPSDYRQRCSPVRYNAEQLQRNALVQPPVRSQSPMAHLPYEDLESYRGPPEHRQPSPLSTTSEFSDTSIQSKLERPQSDFTGFHASHRATFPTPITIPAPRTPPLVEDTPKKPLTLACFFCRKRKIACGSPPPGKKDRTCK